MTDNTHVTTRAENGPQTPMIWVLCWRIAFVLSSDYSKYHSKERASRRADRMQQIPSRVASVWQKPCTVHVQIQAQ